MNDFFDRDQFQRRNFLLGVANGALFQFGISLFSPQIVLPDYISTLAHIAGWDGAANALAGLIAQIFYLGWFLPQLFVADLLQRNRYKLPIYRRAAALRISCVLVLVILLALLNSDQAKILAVSTIVLFGMFGAFGGVSGSAFMDIVAKVIPANRRGKFFGTRMFIGGILGLVAGQFVRVVQSWGLPFPKDGVILFSAGLVSTAIGLTCFAMVKEPPGIADSNSIGWWRQIGSAPRIIRQDKNYRRFMLVRLGNAITAMSVPFFTLFALGQLGAPQEMKGTFISVIALSGILSNPFWSYISDRYGRKPTLIFGTLILAMSPLIAILSGHIPVESNWRGFRIIRLLTASNNPVHNFFCLAFVMVGIGRMGYNIGNLSYLLDIAPEEKRPTYVGLMNTATAPMMLIPMIGGYLINITSYQVAFVISLMAGLTTAVLSARLEKPVIKQG